MFKGEFVIAPISAAGKNLYLTVIVKCSARPLKRLQAFTVHSLIKRVFLTVAFCHLMTVYKAPIYGSPHVLPSRSHS